MLAFLTFFHCFAYLFFSIEININFNIICAYMQCDMCGADSFLSLTKVEGTTLKLCKNCSKYGTVIRKIYPEEKKEPLASVKFVKKTDVDEMEQMIVSDYAEVIKKAREKKGIKQEDFAKEINEKESVIHHLETAKMKPNITLAKKLEHFLGITLIEEVELQDHRNFSSNKKAEILTLGDVIKIRKS